MNLGTIFKYNLKIVPKLHFSILFPLLMTHWGGWALNSTKICFLGVLVP